MSNTASSEYDVFISGSRTDRVVSLQIYRILLTEGYRVFCDPGDNSIDRSLVGIVAGQITQAEIMRALDNTSKIIVVIGHDTINSKWVNEEISHWINSNGKSSIIPVYLDISIKPQWKAIFGEIQPLLYTGHADISFSSELIRAVGPQKAIAVHADAPPTRFENIFAAVNDSLKKSPDINWVNSLIIQSAANKIAKLAIDSKCEVDTKLYYEISRDILRHLVGRRRAKVTNILRHHEWQSMEFARWYLEDERELIATNKIIVERFIVGTASQFAEVRAIDFVEKNFENGVQVRRVVIDESDEKNELFNLDIGIFSTLPISFLRGYVEDGYLVYGEFGIDDNSRRYIQQQFDMLEEFASVYVKRQKLEYEFLERSRAGWRAPYFDAPETAWQINPCPMIEGRLQKFMERAIATARSNKETLIRIVDAGCGDGRNLAYCTSLIAGLPTKMLDGLSFELIGVDFCDTAVEHCKNLLSTLVLPDYIRYFVYESNIVDAMPCKSASVDIIFAVDLFGHLYPTEIPYAISEFRRSLKKRGQLFFNLYKTDDDTRTHCVEAVGKLEGSSIDRDFSEAYWYRDTYYKYYEQAEVNKLLLHFDRPNKKLRQGRLEIQEWRDPPP